MNFTKYRNSKIIFIALFIVILGSGIVSARDYNNGLYFLDSINVKGAKKLLKNKNLKKSYIINLDNGIDKNFYKNNYDTYFAGADSIEINHNYFTHPWSGQKISNNHGTYTVWPILEIIYALKFDTNPIKVISFKISDQYGNVNANNLYIALNRIISLLKEKNINIAAVNYSSSLYWKRPESKTAQNELRKIKEKIDELNNFGISFVTSAGNDNTYMKSHINYFNNTLVIGGVNINDKRAIFDQKNGSSYGKYLDLVAPAIDIKVGKEKFDSGTSYAAPMVSTTIALMKSINPNLTVNQINTILFNSSHDLGFKGKDIYTGYGLLNMEEAVKKVIK